MPRSGAVQLSDPRDFDRISHCSERVGEVAEPSRRRIEGYCGGVNGELLCVEEGKKRVEAATGGMQQSDPSPVSQIQIQLVA